MTTNVRQMSRYDTIHIHIQVSKQWGLLQSYTQNRY